MSEEENDQEQPLISLVWLLKQSRYLDVATLKEVAEEAWGVSFSTEEIDPEELERDDADPDALDREIEEIINRVEDEDDEEASDEEGEETANIIVGAPPIFIIHCNGQMFTVNAMSSPYLEDPEDVANTVSDTRVQKIILDHNAWLSVDYMFNIDEEGGRTREEVYGRIATLIADLGNDDCLALYCPETEQLVPYSPDLPARLREARPLDVFSEFAQLPVINVADDDPRMVEAVEEARRRWPEFFEAFQKRYPGQQFAVKAPITSEGHTEFIWVEVDGIGGATVFGRLANDPVDLAGIKFGDRVEVDFDQVNDWLFTSGEEVTGLFTAKALKEIMDEQEADEEVDDDDDGDEQTHRS